jgi:2-keto-3-deoxy-L-rhamnonate aldolase RhmA
VQTNKVKVKLKAGECVYGTSLSDCLDPEMAVILASAGLDFFFVDTEHSTASYSQIQALCRTARAAGIVPLARVTQDEPYLISRMADVGPMGIIVPRVHSPAAGRAAIEALKFPPLGRRGFGLRSIITDLQGKLAPEEVDSCNRETLMVLMIESKEGLAHVEEIASLEGVDVLFIGPYDLSLAMGILEQFDDPRFWGAVDSVVRACEKAHIAAGLQTGNMPILLKARDRGIRFLLCGSDVEILLAGYRQAIKELKAETTIR